MLQYLLDAGEAETVNVKWGKGFRNVIVISGKKYPYKVHGEINKRLSEKVSSLYIDMSPKALNKKNNYN